MSLANLELRERKVYSQNGEDGVLEAIFETIGTTNRTFVEFGCEHAMECNAACLLAKGWSGLFMDGTRASQNPLATVHNEFITAENIDALLHKYNVPTSFDLLSIDIDGNDFWVWKQIAHRARVVVIEYNAHVPVELCRTIPYDPWFTWSGTDFFGASLLALARLGRQKAYTLVYCERSGVNAFFIADEALPPGYVPPPIESVYRAPNYYYRGVRHKPEPARTMIDPFACAAQHSTANSP